MCQFKAVNLSWEHREVLLGALGARFKYHRVLCKTGCSSSDFIAGALEGVRVPEVAPFINCLKQGACIHDTAL